MNFKRFDIPDLVLFEPNIMVDNRGLFAKTFTKELFEANGIQLDILESYYSVSAKDVIRGMHFQTPPMEHNKLVYVTQGAVLDVVLDIRKGSPTFGKCFSTILSEENRNVLFIPIGFAHGFKSLADNSCIVYNQSSVYAPDHDGGILYNSFGFDWQLTETPILSPRDLGFESFNSFSSPFTYSSNEKKS